MTRAFAAATDQEFGVYYAQDRAGSGKNKVLLTGQNAEAAWRTPIKANACDLSGRLSLVIGMPILIVDNVAVELGLCNGSKGTLVSVQYVVRDGKRYALSVEVDVPSYQNPQSSSEHPHRVLL
ncbi:hypothetical protein BDZ89DRAFT_923026, partial [Hymenopellis radicata]